MSLCHNWSLLDTPVTVQLHLKQLKRSKTVFSGFLLNLSKFMSRHPKYYHLLQALCMCIVLSLSSPPPSTTFGKQIWLKGMIMQLLLKGMTPALYTAVRALQLTTKSKIRERLFCPPWVIFHPVMTSRTIVNTASRLHFTSLGHRSHCNANLFPGVRSVAWHLQKCKTVEIHSFKSLSFS